jgi:hypothetical protein
MKHQEKTKKPLLLSMRGKPQAVVQNAQAHTHLFEAAARVDASEGIRQGQEDVRKGHVRPAREALEMFRRKHEIRR